MRFLRRYKSHRCVRRLAGNQRHALRLLPWYVYVDKMKAAIRTNVPISYILLMCSISVILYKTCQHRAFGTLEFSLKG